MSFPLLEISPDTHDVDIALAYATADNFTHAPVYAHGACWLHEAAEACLRRCISLAATQGLRLRIFDAFRPSEAQWKLWEHTPDPNFLADPRRGSPHSRGVAVDVTLLDAQGTPLDMGTDFDAFTPRSHHGNEDVGPQAQKNRMLLLGLMTTAGWDFYRNEWWHYQLFDSREYPLLSDDLLPRSMMRS